MKGLRVVPRTQTRFIKKQSPINKFVIKKPKSHNPRRVQIMRHWKKSRILAFFFLLLIIPIATAFPNSMNINLQTTDNSGNIITGAYTFNFSVSGDSSCSNILYSNQISLTTDSRGIINYTLTNLNVNWNDTQFYFCYRRDGTLKSTIPFSIVPYSLISNYSNYVNWTGVLNAPFVNASWNQTLAGTLYADIKWGYNQTYSGSTYNATYNIHINNFTLHNQTFVYNHTISVPIVMLYHHFP